jgi:MFS family permease
MTNLRQRLTRTFGGLPGTFWVLWSATLIDRLGGFVFPFLALYLTAQRGLSADAVGLIISLGGAGGLAGALAGGVLADRYGRKGMLVVGMVAAAVLLLGVGLARPLPLIAALFALNGFVAGAVRPALSALLADVVPPAHRLRAYGLMHWAVNIGFSVAPIVAGLMARRSYLALFIGDAATTLACAWLVLARVPAVPPPGQHEPVLAGMTRAFRDAVFLRFMLLGALLSLVWVQCEIAMPIDMMAKGIAPETYGMVLAVNGILIMLLSPFVTGRLAAASPVRVLAAAAILTGVGFGLNAIVDSGWLYAAAVAIWTLGEILSTPASGAIVAGIAPPEQRARYSGAYSMTWSLARTLAPTTGGYVLAHLGARWLWAGCLALGVVVAIGQLAGERALTARLSRT